MDKVALRKRYIARRAALSKEEVEDKSSINQALKCRFGIDYITIFFSIRGKKKLTQSNSSSYITRKDKYLYSCNER